MNEQNKTIARNTLLLYGRSIIMMGIGLYTSRIILQVLGIDDMGLYGVVGSVVGMFAFINGILSVGTSRFLTFELGKNNQSRLNDVFCAAFIMHACMAVLIFLLLETIGVWFLNERVNIPTGREYAANWAFQMSILTCCLGLTQVPYGAVIIAREKMNLFAYVGLAEALFKCVVPMTLLFGNFGDNLIAYSIILAIWSISIQIFYRLYCIRHFPETRLRIIRDKSVYKSMLSFSFWDFLGQICASLNGTLISILINIFFNVRLNAAQGVASQVQGKVASFVGNFMMAANPQIVKSYAANDIKRFFELIYGMGKHSAFLFLFLALPVFMECEYILSIWLEEVPPYTHIFLRCIMLLYLFRIIAQPIIRGVHATGDVKFLNLSGGLFAVLILVPGTYLCYKSGLPFWSYFIILTIVSLNGTICEIYSLYRRVKFNMFDYASKTYLNVALVTITSALLPLIIRLSFNEGICRFLLICMISALSTSLSIWHLGLAPHIRQTLLNYIRGKLHAIFRNISGKSLTD